MAFCNSCGAANQDSAKFCVSCGNGLSIHAASPANGGSSSSADSKKYIYIGIIAVAAVASGVLLYKLLSKPDPAAIVSAPSSTVTAELPAPAPVPASTATVGTTSAATSAPSTSTISAAPSAPVNKPRSTEFERQRLQQRDGSYSASETVDAATLTAISDKMNDYFKDDNAYNLSTLDHFSYPIDNYYGKHGVSYDDLYADYTKSANKLAYHKLTPFLSTSTVKRTEYGYEIILNANFEWEKKETGKTGSRDQRLKFKLDNNYKITSINEI
jgi:hypothetical protein